MPKSQWFRGEINIFIFCPKFCFGVGWCALLMLRYGPEHRSDFPVIKSKTSKASCIACDCIAPLQGYRILTRILFPQGYTLRLWMMPFQGSVHSGTVGRCWVSFSLSGLRLFKVNTS